MRHLKKSLPGAATMQFRWNFYEYSSGKNSALYFRVQSEREQTLAVSGFCASFVVQVVMDNFLTGQVGKNVNGQFELRKRVLSLL